MEQYIPPFLINEKMLELVAEIMEKLGSISNINNLEKMPRLVRSNRIKSVHSSLAIENNTLSLQQVSDILNGKRVHGPENEIREVKNTLRAYQELEKINPLSVKDLLKIHKIMLENLISKSGKFRNGDVGVFLGTKIIHTAPPAKMVNELVYNLFSWIKNSKVHPLIKSSIFHYEFEFIHPFEDGNGRMGRFWQVALLSKWKPLFAFVPIESIIFSRQEEYYNALANSNKKANSNDFIIFMLETILQAVSNIKEDAFNHTNHLNERVRKLLIALGDYQMSATELLIALNLKSRETLRENYINPAHEAGLIGLTISDKPTSKNQKYYKK
ncbi:MAG: Fic family protein [Bacillales bacterium]|nr:Fic family protein [Bacillales bacterium]